MGFKHQPKTYLLVFDDPDLEGLEVRARGLSIGELDADDLTVIESLANALISWNLEDETGNVLPATLETLRSYPDSEFIHSIGSAWLRAMTGVSAELGKDSGSGGTFPEESIPMEPLSLSQAS